MLPGIHIEHLSLVAPKSAILTFYTWNDTSVAICLCTVVDGLVQVTNALGILGRHSTWKMRKFSLKKTWNLSITKLPLPLRMCLWHPPPTHQLSIWGSTAFKDHCTFASHLLFTFFNLYFRFVWQVSNAFATLHTCHPLFPNRTSFSHRYFSDECAPLWQVSCSFQFISRAPHLAAFFAQNSFALTVSHFLSRRHILLGFLPTQQILHHFGSFKITPSIPFHFLASLFLLRAQAPSIQYIVEFLHCTYLVHIYSAHCRIINKLLSTAAHRVTRLKVLNVYWGQSPL